MLLVYGKITLFTKESFNKFLDPVQDPFFCPFFALAAIENFFQNFLHYLLTRCVLFVIIALETDN